MIRERVRDEGICVSREVEYGCKKRNKIEYKSVLVIMLCQVGRDGEVAGDSERERGGGKGTTHTTKPSQPRACTSIKETCPDRAGSALAG